MAGIRTSKRLMLSAFFILMSSVLFLVAVLIIDWNQVQDHDDLQNLTYSRFDNKLHPSLFDLVSSYIDPFSTNSKARYPLYAENIPISISVANSPNETIAFITSSGGITGFNGQGYLEALVPFKLIQPLTQIESVLSIALIRSPKIMESDEIGEMSRSLFWNQAKYKGSSVKVGILDGGFVGISELMGKELPETINSRCYSSIFQYTENVITDCEITTNHGTSVAEIIFDVAPEAEIYVSNPGSPAAMRDAVEWMVYNGVDVINHSMGWSWDGPGDGTSPRPDSPLHSVDFAVGNGIVWVNGVGNEAKSTWFGSFSDIDKDSLLDFNVGSNSNFIQLNKLKSTTLQLRWEDSWDAAESDLNIYLYPYGKSVSESVAWSTSVQSGLKGQIPLEVITYQPKESGRFSFSIEGKSGPFPGWVQVQAFTSENLGIYSQGFSISNPAESSNEGLISVGAANLNSPFNINPNSGLGPTTDGRIKPDLVGPDGLNTKSRGVWSGSSQSSAFVTGLIALVRERFPEFTPIEVARYLKTAAEPRGQNPNNTWGYGFVRLPFLEPGSPMELSVVSELDGPYLSWSPPSFNGGTSLTGYLITGDITEKSITLPPEVTFSSIGLLDVEKINKIQVYAINQRGKSLPATIYLEEQGDGTIKSSAYATGNQMVEVLGLGLPLVGDDYFARFIKWIFFIGTALIIVGARFIFTGSRKKL